MKIKLTLITITCLVTFHSAIAQDKAHLERLAKLEESYQAEIERATTPITTKYRKALESLKTEYTRAGNLEGAIAADKRLQATIQQKESDIPVGAFPANLFETPLRWFEDHMLIVIHEDGTVTTSWDGRKKWRQTGPNEITFEWGSKLIDRSPGEVFGIDRNGKESRLSKATRDALKKTDR